MDKAIKTKWCVALRSGKFMQTTGALSRHAGGETQAYCCLGVLAKIEGAEDASLMEVEETSHEQINYLVDYDTRGRLARMNDDDRANFQQIADYIEKNL